MSGVLSILIIVVCALLILIVLVQNSKGGGLSSSFASNNQIMGVRKTADFLEKTTWGFAIALFVFSLLASPKKQAATPDAQDATTESATRKKLNETAIPAAPAGANSGVANPQQPPTPTK